MEVGRKIYFEKSNGVVIWDKGEMIGDIKETTLEQDKITVPLLNVLDTKGQLGIKQLNYGEFTIRFQTCKGYYISVKDETIVFL